MNNRIYAAFAVAVFAAVSAGFATPAAAQFTITIPKIPKIKKTQPTTAPTTTTSSGSPSETSATQANDDSPAEPAKNGCDGAVMGVYLDDIKKTHEQAAEFKPGLRDYYVQDFNDRKNKYLLAAISPSKRKEFFEDTTPEWPRCVGPALDALNAVVKKTLPTYTPTGYNIRNPAEERVLRSGVTDLAQATVFKVGLASPNWLIEKDSYNFPTARYKYGMIWARYPSLDDGYCRIIYVNVVQDYAGGGTYGASYGNFIKSEPAGCPAK